MPYGLLVGLFVLERAHQWESLLSRDWSLRFEGRALPRGAVLATLILIGWGEGIGLYVQGERAFWSFVFWVYAAHVALTAWLALRRSAASAIRGAGSVLVPIVSLAVLSGTGSLDGERPIAWIGFPGFRPPVGIPAAAVLAFVVVAHAVPCLVAGLRRTRPALRLRAAALAFGCAGAEWFLVAKGIWFPEGSLFPDLVDWWNLGKDGGLVLQPVWMAPFFAHVAVDAIRWAGPPAEPRP